MSSDLRPFNRNATCPKCGYEDVSTTYYNDYQASMESAGSRWPRPDYAHLRRTCRHCGYEWYEAPLDAEEASDETR